VQRRSADDDDDDDDDGLGETLSLICKKARKRAPTSGVWRFALGARSAESALSLPPS
jgi:hypothetical protein